MHTTALRLLKHVMGGTSDSKALMNIVEIKEWQFNEHIKNLIQENYIKKNDGIISLQDNAKSKLLLSLSRKLDIERLFHDSNEQLFPLLTEPFTVNQLCINTGFSSSTVYRAISDFESIGVLTKEFDWDDALKSRIPDKIQISSTNKELVTFAKILKTEQESLYEPNAQVIFKNGAITLKKVLSGKITEGQTTGYSLFSDYGIQYNSPYDYYVKQDFPLDIHDILIHIVMAAHEAKDKLGLIIAVVFYAKHKEKFDTIKLRKLSALFGISTTWLDIEGYLRKRNLKNPELFLSWEEFVSKATLYNVPSENYILPNATSGLFANIEKNLSENMTIYLIGGENMRIKNLKGSTKDCDIVVENSTDFERLKSILVTKLNYSRKPVEQFSTEDARILPDDILEHPSSSRIDLFTKKIMHAAVLSHTMVSRADIIDYDNLKVGLLRNEDVFLLKAIASREGDIQDMELLVQGGSHQPSEYQHGMFDWTVVWEEMLLQEHTNHLRDFTTDVFQQLSYLDEQTGIVAPFLDKLKRHVLDRLIKNRLRGGIQPLNHIVELLYGADISEKMIRNRVDSLERDGTLIKKRIGRKVYLELARSSIFPEPTWEINTENLKTYLDWRFTSRTKPSDPKIRAFSDDLLDFGYTTIGEIDDIVIHTLAVATNYEKDHFPKFNLTAIGFTKICVKLSNISIGNINGYQVSELRNNSS